LTDNKRKGKEKKKKTETETNKKLEKIHIRAIPQDVMVTEHKKKESQTNEANPPSKGENRLIDKREAK